MWLKKLLRVEPVKPKEDNLNYFFQIKKNVALIVAFFCFKKITKKEAPSFEPEGLIGRRRNNERLLV